MVLPSGAATSLLLTRADSEAQAAWRGGLFVHTEDFDAAHQRMTAARVEFISPPRSAPYGRVAVFRDIAGNKWDLLGPA